MELSNEIHKYHIVVNESYNQFKMGSHARFCCWFVCSKLASIYMFMSIVLGVHRININLCTERAEGAIQVNPVVTNLMEIVKHSNTHSFSSMTSSRKKRQKRGNAGISSVPKANCNGFFVGCKYIVVCIEYSCVSDGTVIFHT